MPQFHSPFRGTCEGCAVVAADLRARDVAGDGVSCPVRPGFVVFFLAVLPNLSPLGVTKAIGVTLFVMYIGQTSAVSGYLYRRQVDVSLAS